MTRRDPVATQVLILVVLLAWTFWSPLVAQTTLAQLGLTEAAARTFVLDEIKAPTLTRTSRLALAGTGAVLKLPASMRAAAATGLFAWTKTYVSSPAFKTAYDGANRALVISFAKPLESYRTVKVELLDGLKAFDGAPVKPWTLTFSVGS